EDEMFDHCLYPQFPRQRLDLPPRLLIDGDALTQPALLLSKLYLTRHQDLSEARRGRRGAHVLHQATDVPQELLHREEALDVDGRKEDRVAQASRLRLAAAGARQGPGEDVHHDCQPIALVCRDTSE